MDKDKITFEELTEKAEEISKKSAKRLDEFNDDFLKENPLSQSEQVYPDSIKGRQILFEAARNLLSREYIIIQEHTAEHRSTEARTSSSNV